MITLNGITYNVKYEKSINGNFMKREVTLYHNKNIGHFTIEGQYEPKTGYKNTGDYFDSGNTCSMTINIDESYQRKGLSPIMINYMIYNIEKDYPKIKDDQYLYIDADGSAGFWNSIGMKEHEYSFDTTSEELEGEGYEKRITFRELKQYVNTRLKSDKYMKELQHIEKTSPKRTRSRSPKRTRKRTRSRSPKHTRSYTRKHGKNITLSYKKEQVYNSVYRTVTLFHNGDNIGHFIIEGENKPSHSNNFNSGSPYSMRIKIDEKYRKKGLSRTMIKHMMDNIKRDSKIKDNQYLYIDIDGSNGFWNSIGMKTYNNVEGKGYEKRITFKELKKYGKMTRKRSRSQSHSRKVNANKH